MNTALAYSSPVIDPRRAHALRKKHIVAPSVSRSWSEIEISESVPQCAVGEPSTLTRPQLFALIAASLIAHAVFIGILGKHSDSRSFEAHPSKMTFEFVRPPEPAIPPVVEPPKPLRAKQVAAHTPAAVPPIEQSPQIQNESSASAESEAELTADVSAAPESTPIESTTAPIGRAGYLNNPPPVYPPQAVKQGWQGTVLLRVHVLATGKVDTIELQESSGRKLLDDEAIRTVRKWLFTPATQGAAAVDGWAVVPIEFLLDA